MTDILGASADADRAFAAAPSSPSVSPVPASIPSAGWVAGSFMVATKDGLIPVAGWIKGVFALDFRVFCESAWDDESEHGWQVTHLPTGLKVCGILAALHQATSLVDDLANRADWAKVTVNDSIAECAAPFAAFKDANPGIVVRWPTRHSPLLKLPASGMSAGTAETPAAQGEARQPDGDSRDAQGQSHD